MHGWHQWNCDAATWSSKSYGYNCKLNNDIKSWPLIGRSKSQPLKNWCSSSAAALSSTGACRFTACINPTSIHTWFNIVQSKQGTHNCPVKERHCWQLAAKEGHEWTQPSQPTGQAGHAPLLEGDSDSDKAFDFGLTDRSTEDDDSGMYTFMDHHTLSCSWRSCHWLWVNHACLNCFLACSCRDSYNRFCVRILCLVFVSLEVIVTLSQLIRSYWKSRFSVIQDH